MRWVERGVSGRKRTSMPGELRDLTVGEDHHMVGV